MNIYRFSYSIRLILETLGPYGRSVATRRTGKYNSGNCPFSRCLSILRADCHALRRQTAEYPPRRIRMIQSGHDAIKRRQLPNMLRGVPYSRNIEPPVSRPCRYVCAAHCEYRAHIERLRQIRLARRLSAPSGRRSEPIAVSKGSLNNVLRFIERVSFHVGHNVEANGQDALDRWRIDRHETL